jgi:RNA polymerase sigma factor (sigma-70 family)
LQEQEVIQSCQEGEVWALGELYETHHPAVFRTAYGIIGHQQLAEDVTQQVFIELFSSIGRYDSRRPFPPWLHRIAVSRSLDELRRRKNKPLPLEDAGELRSELPSPEEAAERSETQAAVQGRLRRSSPSTGPPWYSVTTTGSAKQR